MNASKEIDRVMAQWRQAEAELIEEDKQRQRELVNRRRDMEDAKAARSDERLHECWEV